MRCLNCGWENPDENVKCMKCNAALEGAAGNHAPAYETVAQSEVLKGTVLESQVFGNAAPSAPANCPACGYPMSPEMKDCPNCGHGAGTAATVGTAAATPTPTPAAPKNQMGTVNPWMQPQVQVANCSLKPVAWDDEPVAHNPQTYTGEEIVLNRANTEPSNQTITSKEQAVLIHEADGWYIEDRSSQHTTLIQVRKKTKIEDGDIIVLGNRMFEFKG